MDKKIIVFTNGCFDILHVGHIRLLKKAKSLGDCLVVGLNSDKSIQRLKGKGRPINEEAYRMEMLLAIKYVDEVMIFNESVPIQLIKDLKPDVYVKGVEWKDKSIPEEEFVKGYGGKVVFVEHEVQISTTDLLRRLK